MNEQPQQYVFMSMKVLSRLVAQKAANRATRDFAGPARPLDPYAHYQGKRVITVPWMDTDEMLDDIDADSKLRLKRYFEQQRWIVPPILA